VTRLLLDRTPGDRVVSRAPAVPASVEESPLANAGDVVVPIKPEATERAA